jgi:hypothetical protein
MCRDGFLEFPPEKLQIYADVAHGCTYGFRNYLPQYRFVAE